MPKLTLGGVDIQALGLVGWTSGSLGGGGGHWRGVWVGWGTVGVFGWGVARQSGGLWARELAVNPLPVLVLSFPYRAAHREEPPLGGSEVPGEASDIVLLKFIRAEARQESESAVGVWLVCWLVALCIHCRS